MNTWIRWALAILAALATGIGLAGGLLAFSSNTPTFDGERSVTIPEGTSFETTLDSLESAGLLTSTRSMRWFGQLTGWQNQVKAGHYAFASGASNWDLLDTIRKGLQTPVRVTIPPGTTPEVAAQRAARNMAFDADAFRAALSDSSLADELGTTPTDLFGYMLPDTYHFYWQTSPASVVEHIKTSFDRFAEQDLRDGLDAHDLNVHDAAILASIVEWETGLSDEKPRVAGVYLNRLEIGMPLQADPTVQYAVMEEEGSKRRLLFADYDIEHDYNTYQFRGLPPGPLTNPSRSSLRAVARPESHSYLYFVADGTGGHTFSRTLREHNRAAQDYYELMRQRRAQQNN
ncbi:aminodeoxychorismate lyase [Longimonas halophila]|uniref:Endolytic murein transglycosylase n=1 Tax=Longimonas halophila TaxID=1469170 RepID=A0A2H3NRR1_9BACT|nr:endolytic transglycosylase MltG [Longimonas halophila]PEN06228.1 aminodeoxychorismate lyase [Longimonas halophila]